MAALLAGYARCSTDQHELTAQRDGPLALAVAGNRIWVEHGLTRTTRDRPPVREALAACREGDAVVAGTLDRPAQSPPDSRAATDEPTADTDIWIRAGRCTTQPIRSADCSSLSWRRLLSGLPRLAPRRKVGPSASSGNVLADRHHDTRTRPTLGRPVVRPLACDVLDLT